MRWAKEANAVIAGYIPESFNFGPMHLMKDLIKYYLIKIAKVTSEKEKIRDLTLAAMKLYDVNN